jgi:hypothetical protein
MLRRGRLAASPLALLLALLLARSAAAQTNSSLFAFAAALRGNNTGALSNWAGALACTGTNSLPTSGWTGVKCNGVSGANAVSRITLPAKSLFGTISCDLASIPTLTFIDLSNNYLTGSIPDCLFSLTAAWFLDVSRNWLTGALPALPGTYPSNQLVMSVFDNQLSGTVHQGYTRLKALAIAMNPEIVGAWPATLEVLSYSASTTSCQFTGSNAYSPQNGDNDVIGEYRGASQNTKGWLHSQYCAGLYSPLSPGQLDLRGRGESSMVSPWPPTAANVQQYAGFFQASWYTGWYPSMSSGYFYGACFSLHGTAWLNRRSHARAPPPRTTFVPRHLAGPR